MVNEKITLRPDPTTPTIVGRDENGLGWFYLDASKGKPPQCQGCGRMFVYGFISANIHKKRCDDCVEVRS